MKERQLMENYFESLLLDSASVSAQEEDAMLVMTFAVHEFVFAVPLSSISRIITITRPIFAGGLFSDGKETLRVIDIADWLSQLYFKTKNIKTKNIKTKKNIKNKYAVKVCHSSWAFMCDNILDTHKVDKSLIKGPGSYLGNTGWIVGTIVPDMHPIIDLVGLDKEIFKKKC